MGKKHRKPKVKMRSYGGGEELPIVKSKQGLFKKPEFFLIGGDYYDPESNTKFPGESTTPIKGPSKRAIKGKGKRSGEAYLEIGHDSGRPTHADDFAAMENITPIQQKCSSQSGMESAVKRWQSPHKLTGDPNAGINQTLKTAKAIDDKAKKEKKEKAVQDHMLRQAGFIGSNEANKSEEKATAPKSKKDLKQEKKATKQAEKEAYRKTDEYKEKRAKTTDTVQAVGRAMMAYAGLTPGEAGESATEKLEKEKAKEPSEEAGKPKTDLHTDDSGDVLEEEVVEIVDDKDEDKGTTAGPKRRGDIEAMSSMMRKIRNPQKRS